MNYTGLRGVPVSTCPSSCSDYRLYVGRRRDEGKDSFQWFTWRGPSVPGTLLNEKEKEIKGLV